MTRTAFLRQTCSLQGADRDSIFLRAAALNLGILMTCYQEQIMWQGPSLSEKFSLALTTQHLLIFLASEPLGCRHPDAEYECASSLCACFVGAAASHSLPHDIRRPGDSPVHVLLPSAQLRTARRAFEALGNSTCLCRLSAPPNSPDSVGTRI